MQFIIRREALQRELALLQEVAAQKNANPILSCVKLEVEDGKLSLAATDTSVSMFSTCGSGDSGLTVSEDGIAIVDAKRLHGYVKAMEGSEVALSTDEENWLHLSCESAKFRMQGYAAIDFPQLPEPPDDAITSQLPGIALADLIERIEYAIDMGESRYTLSGAFMEVVSATEKVEATDSTPEKAATPAVIRLVATDGFRLSIATRTGEFADPWTVLIPKKGLSAIASMARSGQGGAVVELSKNSNHVFAVSGRRTIASLLLAGQFPDWRNIVNAVKTEKFAVVDTRKFRSAAARVAMVLDGKTDSGIKLNFLASGNLTLESINRTSGEDAKEEVGIGYRLKDEATENKDLTLRVNHRFLLDFVNPAKSSMLRAAGADSATPLRLTDGNLRTDGYQYDYILLAINENAATAPIPEKPKKEKAEKKQVEKVKPEPTPQISDEEARKKYLDNEVDL